MIIPLWWSPQHHPLMIILSLSPSLLIIILVDHHPWITPSLTLPYQSLLMITCLPFGDDQMPCIGAAPLWSPITCPTSARPGPRQGQLSPKRILPLTPSSLPPPPPPTVQPTSSLLVSSLLWNPHSFQQTCLLVSPAVCCFLFSSCFYVENCRFSS